MADIEDLLARTSRTFGLAIPLLAPPLRQQVTLAYLLFRIADTLEDAQWPRQQRLDELARLRSCVDPPQLPRAHELTRAWQGRSAGLLPDYNELLQCLPQVLAGIMSLDGDDQNDDAAEERLDRGPHQDLPRHPSSIVLTHVRRTIEGMMEYVRRNDEENRLVLTNLTDLRDYCYAVAGIVGEMLTELFVRQHPQLERRAPQLMRQSRSFGEGLQLVNILKDAHEDADLGRFFIGDAAVRREAWQLARNDLQQASAYRQMLIEGDAPRDVVTFVTLPLELAYGTLDAVQKHGPGAKLTRTQVASALKSASAQL